MLSLKTIHYWPNILVIVLPYLWISNILLIKWCTYQFTRLNNYQFWKIFRRVNITNLQFSFYYLVWCCPCDQSWKKQHTRCVRTFFSELRTFWFRNHAYMSQLQIWWWFLFICSWILRNEDYNPFLRVEMRQKSLIWGCKWGQMRRNCRFWGISSLLLWGHLTTNKSPRSEIFWLFPSLHVICVW
jgi:hypothetical protein